MRRSFIVVLVAAIYITSCVIGTFGRALPEESPEPDNEDNREVRQDNAGFPAQFSNYLREHASFLGKDAISSLADKAKAIFNEYSSDYHKHYMTGFGNNKFDKLPF